MQKSSRLRPVICKLTASSAKDIAAIELHCSNPPWNEGLIIKEFSNQCSRIDGARFQGKLVGFMITHVVCDEAHIVNIGVDPNLRGQGIGSFLLNSILGDLNCCGVRWVTLEVRRSNSVARSLYDQLGFLEVGIREKYYTDNCEDALVLKLNLQQYMLDIAPKS